MQNWDSLQTANYELNWYNNAFSTGKIDSHPTSTTMEQCFNMRQQSSSMDVTSPTPSPKNSDCQEMNYLDNSNELTSTGTHHPLGFNPLTPPGLPNAVLPSMNYQTSDLSHNSHKQENDMKIDENSLTPRNTPPVDVTPPKSPKNFNNHEPSLDNDMLSNSSEDTRFIESEDDELIRVPIYNSHGKMKNYKCKHCGFLAITKIAFWNHAREHIKPEKMLQCPKCPFVTELKHHLEYHIRKHKNLKPFQCDKCNYSCVNKSMLNSHLKSHSSVYQYRCSDCDYATKYCHSFKLHLRKYDHKPGMVLDEDGTPNPSVVIDVYGTRRGPKMKATKSKSKANSKLDSELEVKAFQSNEKIRDQKTQLLNDQLTSKLQQTNGKNARSPVSNLLPNNLANMLHQTRNMPFLPYFNLNLQMIAAQQHAAWTQIPSQIQQNIFRSSDDDGELNKSQNTKDLSDEEDNIIEEKCEPINGAMDLSQTTLIKADVLIQNQNPVYHYPVKEEQNIPTITSSSSSSSSKRKSRHNKSERDNQMEMNSSITEKSNTKEIKENDAKKIAFDSKTELPSSSSQDDYKNNNMNENHNEKSASTSSSPSTGTSIDCSTSTTIQNNNTNFQIPGIFECKYCDIYFKDAVLYTIHMGYHSCDDVFKCNMCGEKCDGPVGLFIHMARNAHS